MDLRDRHVVVLASPASLADHLRWPIQTLKVGSIGTHKALGLARAKHARLLLAGRRCPSTATATRPAPCATSTT